MLLQLHGCLHNVNVLLVYTFEQVILRGKAVHIQACMQHACMHAW